MKRLLFFALLLFFDNPIFAQEIKTDSLLTEKQNAEWISEFEKLDSKSEQIAEIKKKIFADTIYKRQQNYCGIVIKNQETVQETMRIANCECKIVFVLSLKKKHIYLTQMNIQK